MVHKVLVPLDGSAFAGQILPYLQQIYPATASDATKKNPADKDASARQLLLLSVITPDMYANAVDPLIMQDRLLPAVHKQLTAYQQNITQELQTSGYDVTSQVVMSDAASAIIATATENQVDLIAMTTHGRTGVSRALLGSIADQVARNTLQPLLLLRSSEKPATPQPIRRILAPLDGSTLAECALPHTQSLARQHDALVVLIRAIQPPDMEERELHFADESMVAEMQAQMINIASYYLERIQLRLQMEGVRSSWYCQGGRPAQVILAQAESQAADLIVMSTHGRSGLNRWVYGSVANQVLHQATCPLLLVHGTETVKTTRRLPNALPLPA